MRWSVKEYLLKAGICQLCTGDQVGVNTALDRYRELDPSFQQQREHALLVDLAAAVQDGDQEMFADKVCDECTFRSRESNANASCSYSSSTSLASWISGRPRFFCGSRTRLRRVVKTSLRALPHAFSCSLLRGSLLGLVGVWYRPNISTG
jgi:hypothetical protein